MESVSIYRCVGSAVVIVMCIWANGAAQSAPGELESLEARVLQARSAIESGDFYIDIHQPRQRIPDSRQRICFAPGGRSRLEIFHGAQRMFSLSCPTGVFASNATIGAYSGTDRTRWPVVFKQAPNYAGPVRPPFGQLDPRVLMLLPTIFTGSATDHVPQLVGIAGRDQLKIKPDVWNGLPAAKVTCNRDISETLESQIEYVVVPSRGFNIVRWRVVGSRHMVGGATVHFDNSAECQLAEVATGIWFPSTVHTIMLMEGKLNIEETLQIQTASINANFEDAVFSLESLGVADGAVVEQRLADGRPSSTSFIWEQQKLRPATSRDFAAIAESGNPAPRGFERAHLFWEGALLLGAAGVCSLVYAVIDRFVRGKANAGGPAQSARCRGAGTSD